MRSKMFLILLIVFNTFSFEYNFYNKVYILKIENKELYDFIKATDKQKIALSDLFEKTDKKSYKIENKLISFEEKKEKLSMIEKERDRKILEILNEEQFSLYEKYISIKKKEFEEKNRKIKKFYAELNLSNEQKYKLFRIEKKFKKLIKELEKAELTSEEIKDKFLELENQRNKRIEEVLDERQMEIFKNFN